MARIDPARFTDVYAVFARLPVADGEGGGGFAQTQFASFRAITETLAPRLGQSPGEAGLVNRLRLTTRLRGDLRPGQRLTHAGRIFRIAGLVLAPDRRHLVLDIEEAAP